MAAWSREIFTTTRCCASSKHLKLKCISFRAVKARRALASQACRRLLQRWRTQFLESQVNACGGCRFARATWHRKRERRDEQVRGTSQRCFLEVQLRVATYLCNSRFFRCDGIDCRVGARAPGQTGCRRLARRGPSSVSSADLAALPELP